VASGQWSVVSGQKEPMKFSEQLEQRFADMITHYPTKRAVLVPILLYVQDELGSITDEAIAELARRVDLTELEVRNVISYYSMMRTHPIGKYNLQICTNVSCLLRGGEEILEHCKKKLGVGNKQSTEDGLFHLEEVECIGACSWAPAMQINYDFHENLTAEKIDSLIDGIRKKEQQ
jgi:NADH-quinone oxidoreductase subunit E